MRYPVGLFSEDWCDSYTLQVTKHIIFFRFSFTEQAADLIMANPSMLHRLRRHQLLRRKRRLTPTITTITAQLHGNGGPPAIPLWRHGPHRQNPRRDICQFARLAVISDSASRDKCSTSFVFLNLILVKSVWCLPVVVTKVNSYWNKRPIKHIWS